MKKFRIILSAVLIVVIAAIVVLKNSNEPAVTEAQPVQQAPNFNL